MIILGISAFYHDSAACIIKDGEVLYAAQEERFTRIKHDRNFPLQAITHGLQDLGLTLKDIEHVSYYDKPLLTFDRLFETWLSYAPKGLPSFMSALPVWLHEKLFLSREIDKGLSNEYTGPLHYMLHHQSHAASAFYPSPFQEAAILTIDGVGEWSTTTLGIGQGHRLRLLKEIRFPHSLGLLYSAFTYYLGFRVNSGEYKVMGLAPYGVPRFADLIRKHLIDLKQDGSFWMDMSYFNYCQGLTMTNDRFHELFGGLPRKSESNLTQREMDLAASVQKVCEEVMLALAVQAKKITGADYLCMAGGCALNCVANGLISKEKIFKKLFIQPAAGDAGGSLGAALMTWHEVLGNERVAAPQDSQKGSYLGPEFKTDTIEKYLKSVGASFKTYDDVTFPGAVADQLQQAKVVGFFYGRMEFGPRALGARSILGDARRQDMQSKMNLKIKFRESFRPFAPVVLEEHEKEYFDLDDISPYMLLVGPVKHNHRNALAEKESQGKMGIDLLNVSRSDIPAVTHVDYSARVQTLTPERNGMFHSVVDAFYKKTGCPVLINTSFNIRGEPIVNTPEEAYRCFMFTDMDVLVLQNCILLKEDQPPMPGADEYKKKFTKAD
ncbi:MAG: Decarbamoylnovobiocin carbamoyltransferase [Elusimicrobia bacterium]|nr:Decarbamoylnovobiocin carbamoyltransferase [Elusimicrobiota bacterium]